MPSQVFLVLQQALLSSQGQIKNAEALKLFQFRDIVVYYRVVRKKQREKRGKKGKFSSHRVVANALELNRTG